MRRSAIKRFRSATVTMTFLDIYKFAIKTENAYEYIKDCISSGKGIVLITKDSLETKTDFYQLVTPIRINATLKRVYYKKVTKALDETAYSVPLDTYGSYWIVLDDSISKAQMAKLLTIINSLE